MGTIALRKVVTTEALLKGWGAIHEGRAINGVWSLNLCLAHANYLELFMVFPAFKNFLPVLRGFLVRTDNTTLVAYSNPQGGTRSLQIHRLAHRLLIWSGTHLLLLRVSHVPGVLNT